MAFVAVRGATALKDEIELRAHLATLLRLENVGLLLGAGASVVAGGKTMAGLWGDFLDVSHAEAQWLLENDFINEGALEDKPDLRDVPNVESLGDALEIAYVEWGRQGHAQIERLAVVRAQLSRAVVRAALLQPEWWTSPGGADADAAQLEHHRSVLQKCVAPRQPDQAAPCVVNPNPLSR